MKKALAPPKKGTTTFTKEALKKQSETITTLPEDLHYDFSHLTKLFTKPKWSLPVLSLFLFFFIFFHYIFFYFFIYFIFYHFFSELISFIFLFILFFVILF